MQEKQGNVLVFMSTVAGVNELVQAVRMALAHDPGCIVLGLYADMNDDEKARVTSFHDLSKFPQNRQKRLICVATDLAESGVTIPGRTATTNDPRVCAVPVNDHTEQIMFLLLCSLTFGLCSGACSISHAQ